MKMFRYKIFLSLVLLTGWSTFSQARINVGNAPVRTASTQGNRVAVNCPTTTSQIDLAINNVRAHVLVGGDLWWNPNDNTTGIYEVPRGSGKNVIYAGSLWIGGIDANLQLKVAAQTYRQQGANDFWGGPISKEASGNLTISTSRCNEFDRFWAINKTTVEDFITTGQVNDDEEGKTIKEWPGNGNVANGELPLLAPYFDADNSGDYNYEAGDYPYFFFGDEYPKDPQTQRSICNDYLFGDRTIWWVFNDVGSVKTESNSNPIGLEIRAQAFAFKSNDQINNMTFYKYQIINRSNDSLKQTYFGVWCDPDLGNASDDYVGCDVGLGLGYCYNGGASDNIYGANPPAIGIDFFQGPLADAGDDIDNNKNGVKDEPGEDITMSKFVYYVNTNGIPTGNPAVTDDYYNYLNGEWLDGQRITYGGDGRGSGPGATANPADYMFPAATDPKFPTTWTMVTGNIQPTDMRFLQSAGVFSLAPGAVNYVADGVVFAQATNGGPLASVKQMQSADVKAQKLFNSCFKLKDGPPAPDVAIRELDQEIILSLENVAKAENFKFKDPNIPGIVPHISTGGADTLIAFDTLGVNDQTYYFEGYKIYQLSDFSVKADQVSDESKAKLVAQVDVKNNLSILVNYTKDDALGFYSPLQRTIDVNNGIQHAFDFKQDLFRQKPLANFRPYYYMVIAYAANNFRAFDQSIPQFDLNTQAEPYLEGSKNVFVYSAIPHKQVVDNGGTVAQSSYGTSIAVRRIEGAGNGGNTLDLSQEAVNEALNGPEFRSIHPLYQAGHGPVKVSIYDPLRVKSGGFTLALTGDRPSDKWYLFANPTDSTTVPSISYGPLIGTGVNAYTVVALSPASAFSGLIKGSGFHLHGITGIITTDTIMTLNNSFDVDSISRDTIFFTYADSLPINGSYDANSAKLTVALTRSGVAIGSNNEQDGLYEGAKISIAVRKDSLEAGTTAVSKGNGFIEATMTFSDPSKSWLTGVPDNDLLDSPRNWIAAGPNTGVADATNNIANNPDPTEVYESVLGGTWAPYKVTQRSLQGSPKLNTAIIETFSKFSFLASVDVVITNDQSKWTRCVVVETGEDTMPTIGAPGKFGKRKQASVDKAGRPYTDANANAAEATLTDTVGMGWFPGYAINVETGERLNMIFGENSALSGQNSTDMQWNPTQTNGPDLNGRLSLGGGHYIYVFNKNGSGVSDVPTYDNGRKIDSLLSFGSAAVNKRNVFKDCIWTSLPLVTENHSLRETDVRIRLRVIKNLKQFVSSGDYARNKAPMYQFEVPTSVVPLTSKTEEAKSALELIRVVPNPYYAFSSYEKTNIDKLDNRIRITNLPSKCVVSIYTLNGTLVRQLKRDVVADVSDGYLLSAATDKNITSSIDWDLKNTAGITVASGVYIFHIDAGYLGEKTIKWFGIMRPVDLDSF